MRLTALRRNEEEYVEELIAEDLRQPVLVWQMGKVASRSFVEAIERTGDYAVFHLHHTDPKTIEALREQHDRLNTPYPPNLNLSIRTLPVLEVLRKATDRPVRIVSGVRDPMSRNVSAFFMNLHLFAGDSKHDVDDAQGLTHTFLQRYPHSVPLTWFDREIKAALGFDVFDTPFDVAQACLRASHKSFELLVLRAEDDDAAKERALNSFFARDDLQVVRANVASEKSYAALYEAFLSELVIPDGLSHTLYESRYARHFYTDEERTRLQAAWRTPAQKLASRLSDLATKTGRPAERFRWRSTNSSEACPHKVMSPAAWTRFRLTTPAQPKRATPRDASRLLPGDRHG